VIPVPAKQLQRVPRYSPAPSQKRSRISSWGVVGIIIGVLATITAVEDFRWQQQRASSQETGLPAIPQPSPEVLQP
jgi:hypothetical protein